MNSQLPQILFNINKLFIGWNFYFRKTGKSITLITRSDWRSAAHLIEILEEANQVKLRRQKYNVD